MDTVHRSDFSREYRFPLQFCGKYHSRYVRPILGWFLVPQNMYTWVCYFFIGICTPGLNVNARNHGLIQTHNEHETMYCMGQFEQNDITKNILLWVGWDGDRAPYTP